MKKLLFVFSTAATLLLSVGANTAVSAPAKSQSVVISQQTEIAPVLVVVHTARGPLALLKIQHCGFHDTGWVCQYLDHPAPVPYSNGYLYCLSDYRWHWLGCN
jgi:hypothetical protein